MSAPTLTINAVSCRLCGATHARMRRNSIGKVCDTCWRSFQRSSPRDGTSKKPTENEFNKWFARQIILSTRRLKVYGTVVRCQAATLTAGAASRTYHYHIGGHQCGKWATTKRDGYFVCNRHEKSHGFVPVGTPEHSQYGLLERAFLSLAEADEQFKEMLLRTFAALNSR